MNAKTQDSGGGTSQMSKGGDYHEAGAGIHTIDVFDEEDSGVDPVYHAKASLLNDAFQEIGMGRYQVSMGQ